MPFQGSASRQIGRNSKIILRNKDKATFHLYINIFLPGHVGIVDKDRSFSGSFVCSPAEWYNPLDFNGRYLYIWLARHKGFPDICVWACLTGATATDAAEALLTFLATSSLLTTSFGIVCVFTEKSVPIAEWFCCTGHSCNYPTRSNRRALLEIHEGHDECDWHRIFCGTTCRAD